MPKPVAAGGADGVLEPPRVAQLRDVRAADGEDRLLGQLRLLDLVEQVGGPGGLDINDSNDTSMALGEGLWESKEGGDGLVGVASAQDLDRGRDERRAKRLFTMRDVDRERP